MLQGPNWLLKKSILPLLINLAVLKALECETLSAEALLGSNRCVSPVPVRLAMLFTLANLF
jgi:hypothetical protein